MRPSLWGTVRYTPPCAAFWRLYPKRCWIGGVLRGGLVPKDKGTLLRDRTWALNSRPLPQSNGRLPISFATFRLSTPLVRMYVSAKRRKPCFRGTTLVGENSPNSTPVNAGQDAVRFHGRGSATSFENASCTALHHMRLALHGCFLLFRFIADIVCIIFYSKLKVNDLGALMMYNTAYPQLTHGEMPCFLIITYTPATQPIPGRL